MPSRTALVAELGVLRDTLRELDEQETQIVRKLLAFALVLPVVSYTAAEPLQVHLGEGQVVFYMTIPPDLRLNVQELSSIRKKRDLTLRRGKEIGMQLVMED